MLRFYSFAILLQLVRSQSVQLEQGLLVGVRQTVLPVGSLGTASGGGGVGGGGGGVGGGGVGGGGGGGVGIGGILSGNSGSGREVYSFKGIPFAEPPTGANRFRPALKHQGWPGTYIADAFKPPCAQPSGSAAVKASMSEDCLFLNVWTTQLPRTRAAANTRLLPVIVFIEGQLFTLGNPSDVPAEDLVASQELVFVSVSYRLNAFGFLSWEDDVLPGNLGLSDQLLAMQWVSHNIGAFGGDRRSVTLMGHSCGAASALYHALSPRSNHLFQRVIAMSGSVLAPWALQPRPRANAQRLATSLGCSQEDSSEVLSCLQDKRMTEIVSAVDEMIRGGNISAIFAPVVDGLFLGSSNNNNNSNNIGISTTTTMGSSNSFSSNNFMVELDPEIAIRTGGLKKIPIMTGVVTDEGVLMAYFLKDTIDRLSYRELKFFLDNTVIPSLLSQLHKTTPSIADDLLAQTIHHRYFPTPITSDQDKTAFFEQIIRLFNDIYFDGPLQRQLLFSDSNSFAYVNSFSTLQPMDIFGNGLGRRNASHGADLLYLFGPTMYSNFIRPTVGTATIEFPSFAEERLARNLKAVFSYFASTGEPIPSLDWDSYTLETDNYFDLYQNIAVTPGPEETAFQFWYEYLPEMEAKVEAIAERNRQDTTATTVTGLGPVACTTYVTFTWLLLAAVILLIIVFLVLVVLMMKRTTGKGLLRSSPSPNSFKDEYYDNQNRTVFSVEDASFRNTNKMPQQQQHTMQSRRSRWREAITDHRL